MTEYKSKVKYEPPVELVFDKPIWDEMDRAIEKNVSNINEQVLAASVSACMRVGVKVDKEELIKALRYDRGQYEKGYADGKRDAAAAIEELKAEVKRLQGKLCDWCAVCPKERRNPDDCELLGENPVMYGPSDDRKE